MGVNFNKIGGVNSVYKNQKVSGKAGALEATQVKGKKDEVQISKEAIDFQAIMKSVKAVRTLPDIREDVINPIREKLENGTYNVDSSNIAEKILSDSFDIKI